MKQQKHRVRAAAWFVFGTGLLMAPGASPSAATLRWTGAGPSAFWSLAANWAPLRAPLDGDDLEFAGASPQLNSVLDLSHSFGTLTFTATAQAYALHVQGTGARLTFAGLGIVNLAGGTGPRQQLFADAGTAGGSIVFSGSAGINQGSTGNFRPVNITALGGTLASPVGGQIVLQDQASTGGSSFDALRAEGAFSAGALGGDIVLRDNALATRSSSISVTGGSVFGALGAQARVLGQARVEGAFNVLAGLDGGAGARGSFAGLATATVYAAIVNQGASANVVGAEAATTFSEGAKLVGSASNLAGSVGGASGGRLEFRGSASHDSTGIDPGLGFMQINNGGANVASASGGATVFMDDAFVRGTRLVINNQAQGEGPDPGSAGGTTEFRNRARAGQATVVNEGAAVGGNGTRGGSTLFTDQASADNADISSRSGSTLNAPGGLLRFTGGSTAGGATLRNQGGSVAGAFSGMTEFSGSATAGSATVINAAGEVAQTLGGATRFAGNAGAGTAYISNSATLFSGGGNGGQVRFQDDASAQQARIDNLGGLTTTDHASASFNDRATAGSALIINFGGRAAGAFGGLTAFGQNTSAGAANILAAGGGVNTALGGFVLFSETATAANATIDLRAATVGGAMGGRAQFQFASSAGSAHISVQGSGVDNVLGPEGASVAFLGTATAADASFVVGGNPFAGGGTGVVSFTGASNAGRASFQLLAGQSRGGFLSFNGSDAANVASAADARIVNQSSTTPAAVLNLGGQTSFRVFSTAARASITNAAGTAPGLTNFFANSGAGDASIVNNGGGVDGSGVGQSGGTTQFNNTASAERAVIVNQPGAHGASGFDAAGGTRFVNQSSAGNARITAQGATAAGDLGGLIAFGDNANPAQSTLIAEGGSGGGAGGRIQFSGATNSSAARVVLNAGSGPGSGGTLDISSIGAGVAIGSLEGGGTAALGSKTLAVGFSGASTSFSGLLRDGGVGGGVGGGVDGGSGGGLSVLGGTLTLTSANTYSGVTRIGTGVAANSGKLVVANANGSATGSGPVVVQSGGTLAGSGFIAGPVTLLAGGTVAPGDPVTLTMQDSLTWNGGGLIRLVLGADSAGSDHLNVHTLVRGTDGPFVIELVDLGVVVGATYDLITFNSMVGFAPGDIQFDGLAGSFAFNNGALAFTAMAVPESSTALLFSAGLLAALAALTLHRRKGDGAAKKVACGHAAPCGVVMGF